MVGKKFIIKFRLSGFIIWCCAIFPNVLVANIDWNIEISPDTSSVRRKIMSSPNANNAIEFFGFVKYDLFVDTRQVVNAREGLVSIYPENRHFDALGRDINSGLNVNMLSIHSRVGIRANGPKILTAKTGALIEADFYGNANSQFSDLNGLRLFNAYIDFRWKSTEVRVGQDWHPMSIRDYFPHTVSFSAGAPFHPMSRNPQMRVRATTRTLTFTGAILSQRDFTSTGPDGPSSQYLRNAGLPNLHFQVQYGRDTSFFSGGMGVDYKRLKPAQYTIKADGERVKAEQTVSSSSVTGFMRFRTDQMTLTAQGVYAQNGYDLLLLGGYAEAVGFDNNTSKKSYLNLDVISLWADLNWAAADLQYGIFLGYAHNLRNGELFGTTYSRGEGIEWLYRASPRISYAAGKVGIALEGEYTVAAYDESVANFRSLLSIKYVF